jgi:hypothetical protein
VGAGNWLESVKRFYHAFWMANVARSVLASLQISETRNPPSGKQILGFGRTRDKQDVPVGRSVSARRIHATDAELAQILAHASACVFCKQTMQGALRDISDFA